jgi:stage II sporulation protein D
VRDSSAGALERERRAPGADVGGRMVRIALGRGVARARVGGTGEWRLYDDATRTLLARADAGAVWTVESDGQRVRAVGPAGAPPWRVGPLVARPASLGVLVTHDARRYRGELWVHAAREGVTVVNRVGLEDYLRGVVPLELGTTAEPDLAALQAQAVAARSYAYAHLPEYLPRDDAMRQASLPWDLRAGVSDQVYGGVEAERGGSDRAVIATAGLVLRWNGNVVTAPYHSTCGGATAEPSEVARVTGERWLRRVSDRVPGTLDRYYCDVAPRYRWTREYDGEELAETIGRYLRSYARGAPSAIGAVRALTVEERTPSGRVAALGVRTDAGAWTLRGNDIRFVLRGARGDILASTYFSVDLTAGADGRVAHAVFRGHGNGHGIGMCQWGAIGRSRAGHDYRTILRTYYPGTTIEPAE